VTADGSRAEWLEEKHAQLNGPLPELVCDEPELIVEPEKATP
jgi:hypothetical protein